MLQLLAQASEPHPNQPIIIGLLIAMGLVLIAIIALLVARGRQAKRIAQARGRAEQARREAEEQAKQQAEERARREAEEQARREAEERAEREAEERAQREVEEQLQREAEEEAQREAEEKAKREAEEQAKREVEEKAQRELEEKAKRDAEAKAKREAESKAKRDAEEQKRRDAEGRAKREAEARAKRAADERAKREAEERARRAAQAKAKQEAAKAPAPAPLKDAFKVLLVEDSVTMRMIVEQTLADENCEVVAVSTGGEALAKAQEIKPQLVIADLTLDDKDGYTVCEEIRADGSLAKTPVLLLHGPTKALESGRVEKAGASGDLAKPFATQDLIDKVRQLVGGEGAAAEAPAAKAPAHVPKPAPKPAPKVAAPAAKPVAKAPAPAVKPAAPKTEQAPAPKAAAPAAPAAPAAAGDQPKVLVIDDSLTMRKVLELALCQDFAVSSVENGASALGAAREFGPHVIVADLSLDDKDGYEICRELRQDEQLKQVPVILLHSATTPYDATKAAEVEANDELAKPFASQDLIDKVTALAS